MSDDIEKPLPVDEPEASNPALDALLREETITQEERKSESPGDSDSGMTAAKAEKIAKGVLESILSVPEYLGRPCFQMPEKLAALVTRLWVPVIRKHGPKFESAGKDVNLNSWAPELMGVAGSLVVGLCVAPQLGAKAESAEEVPEHGNQPEHG